MTSPSVTSPGALPSLPTAPGAAPVFGMLSSSQQKPQRKSPTASYLNSSALPSPSQAGMKQLVGT